MEKLIDIVITAKSQIPVTKTSDDILFLLKGIAHDYNNINTIIQGNISVAKNFIKPDNDIYGYLVASEEGISQAKELSRLLLSYTNGPIKKEAIPLRRLITEISEFLLRNSQVKVIYDFSEKEIIIQGVEVEIKQIIRNLILNAEQAMPDGGMIRISATETHLSNDNQYFLPKGKYTELTIENNGKGIPKEKINMIFEPHYTTKIHGHGLGLAICHSIVKKHQGRIIVNSENGNGAKFKILLPIDVDQTGVMIEE